MYLVFTQYTYLQFLSYPHTKPRQPQIFLCTCQSRAAPNPLAFRSVIASHCAFPAPAHTRQGYTVASSVEDLTGQGRGRAIQAFSPELLWEAGREGEARLFICLVSGHVNSTTSSRAARCLELPRAPWGETSK